MLNKIDAGKKPKSPLWDHVWTHTTFSPFVYLSLAMTQITSDSYAYLKYK